MTCGRVALAALLLAAPRLAHSDDALARRGPFEARDGFLLAQRRLTLPALSPDPLPPRASWARLDLDWGNDFARRQSRYVIDGEHRALAITLRHGVTESLTLGVRVPLLWRGGGFLDRFADWIHKLGFPDNGRPFFPRDLLVVSALERGDRALSWGGSTGRGLGKLELEARLAPLRRDTSWLSVALVGRIALPTGTGQFAAGGVEGGGQLAAALGLGERWDAYGGVGVTVAGEPFAEGVAYTRSRGFGHLALEWRFARRWSAIAQVDGSGRVVTNLRDYPWLQSYLRLGLKRDLGRTQVEAAFSENLKSQQSTTDFGVYLALARRF